MKTFFRKNQLYVVVLAIVWLVMFDSCSTSERFKEVIVNVESISLNTSSASLTIGASEVLKVSFNPVDATDQTVTWGSSNQNVATVRGGLVEAKGVGTAIITATTSNGKKATCHVTVENLTVDIEGIELDKNVLSLVRGGTATLIATVKPLNATDKTVVWESANVQVATVDNQGKVVAVAVGTAKITAKAGSFSAVCEVSVTEQGVPVTKIELNKTTLSLAEGAEERLVAEVFPENTTDVVEWSSENGQIATVDNTGMIKAVGVGVTSIVAKAGDKIEKCTVTVVPVSTVDVVTSLILNKTILKLKEGDFEVLQATVVTKDDSQPDVLWSSSDVGVVTVDADGMVEAVAVGEAVVTAKAGEKSAACTVTVTSEFVAITSLEVSPSGQTMDIGEELQLTVQVIPSNATSNNISWYSQEPTMAMVDISTGLVKALSAGRVVIKAVVDEDHDIADSCVIHIREEYIPVTSIRFDKTNVVLTEHGTDRIVAEILPVNATIQKLTWNSGNETVATVDEYGNISAIAEGSTVITAEADGVFASCSVRVEAQEGVTITNQFEDLNFRAFLLSQFDADSNGELSTAEVKDVTELHCYLQNISSLKGIEYFKSLQVLDCHDNSLQSIDLSQNTSLISLVCRNNNLSSLNVGMLTDLETLNCSENNLSSLDVSGNGQLKELFCSDNEISQLAIYNNVNLFRLNCSKNNLSALDVSSNMSLVSILCSENNIRNLNVDNNGALNNLACADCGLTMLNLSNNPKLTNLDCRNNELSSLDLSTKEYLSSLYCSNNHISGDLDISKTQSMDALDCTQNQISRILVSASLKVLVDAQIIKTFIYDDGVAVEVK